MQTVGYVINLILYHSCLVMAKSVYIITRPLRAWLHHQYFELLE